MELFRILVVCMLVGIVLSLASALYHLASGKGDSSGMVKALTVRIALSIALFVAIMVAWKLGYVAPHGLQR
jgi:hypothetical protein